MAVHRCIECGKTYDWRGGTVAPGHTRTDLYCSAKCQRAGEAAKAAGAAESAANAKRGFKLIGIAVVVIFGVFTVLCYTFPKFLKKKNKKFLYAYIITWAVLIAGTAVYFSFFSPAAVSGIKIKTVSASCETEEQFVSILKEGLSGVSATMLEDEEFTTYSRQALDAVKERNSAFKDAVYFVRLPDNINVYIWFKTKEQTAAYVYKTE